MSRLRLALLRAFAGASLLAFVLPAWGQEKVVYQTADAALEARADGEPLHGHVSRAAGAEALERLRFAGDDEVPGLVAVARAGGSQAELAPALVGRVIANPGDAEQTLRFALRLRGEQLEAAVAEQASAWGFALEELLDTSELIPVPALALYARGAGAAEVIETVEAWADPAEGDPEAALVLLRESAKNRDSLGLFQAILAAELPPELEQQRHTTLRLLASGDPQVGEFVRESLARGSGPTELLLESMSGMRGAQVAAAAEILKRLIAQGEVSDEAMVAALRRASPQPNPELLEAVLPLAEAADSAAVRAAALAALPGLLGDAGGAPAERVATVLIEAVEAEEGAPLGAALAAANALDLSGLDELLPELAGPEYSPEVHLAAARLIVERLPHELETAALLIPLLEDPRAARAAWEGLKVISGLKLPLRADQWRLWYQREAARQGLASELPLAAAAPAVTRPEPAEWTWPSLPSLLLGLTLILSLIWAFQPPAPGRRPAPPARPLRTNARGGLAGEEEAIAALAMRLEDSRSPPALVPVAPAAVVTHRTGEGHVSFSRAGGPGHSNGAES